VVSGCIALAEAALAPRAVEPQVVQLLVPVEAVLRAVGIAVPGRVMDD